MFTGIVQGLGYCQAIGPYQLGIQCLPETASLILADLAVGDSVAVDGVCLTVETLQPQGFLAAVSPETLSRTTLGRARQGQHLVNLEPSLRVGGKLGGHFVTGHVDSLGILDAATATATSWWLRINVSGDPGYGETIMPLIVSKGSISVNGISLTIADCAASGEWFTTAIIPHTYASTNLHQLALGSPVNLEADILGKYVQRLLRTPPSPTAHPPLAAPLDPLDTSFLKEHGYL